jgi:hypothetical protein
MVVTIACVAPGLRNARAAAAKIAARLPRACMEAFSLAGYLAAPDPPGRVVLCPEGRSLGGDLAFLALVAERLLWPSPSTGFRDAIGGIRAHPAPPRSAAAAPARSHRRTTGVAAALLLEGTVDLARVRAALAAGSPHDWIVESARRVRLSARERQALARRGIRWASLDPVGVVALYANPALARMRARWKGHLPKGTKVWIREPGAATASSRRPPR